MVDTSTLIAGFSLIVSILAFRNARQATRNSNKPLLRVWVDGGQKENPESFIYYIENNGNGPAIVGDVQYTNGRDYTYNLFSLFNDYASRKALTYETLDKNQAIEKGRIALVSIDLRNLDNVNRSRAYKDLCALNIKLSFSTIGGQKLNALLKPTGN